jgi:hypothetical protein
MPDVNLSGAITYSLSRAINLRPLHKDSGIGIEIDTVISGIFNECSGFPGMQKELFSVLVGNYCVVY